MERRAVGMVEQVSPLYNLELHPKPSQGSFSETKKAVVKQEYEQTSAQALQHPTN
jgi:hypothetical protein